MRVAARVHGASDLRNPQLNVVMLEERERQAELVAVEHVLWFADHDVLGPAMRIAQCGRLASLAFVASCTSSLLLPGRLLTTRFPVKHHGRALSRLPRGGLEQAFPPIAP